MPYSTESGIRIYYESYGEGPPMVLVHANPFDHRLFFYQVARWSSYFRIIAVDLRGYGRSDKPETGFTLADMAADVIGVCKTEGVDRAVFGGVSVGSGICMLIGLDRPDLVQALILVGGGPRGGRTDERAAAYMAMKPSDYAAYRRYHAYELVAPAFAESVLGRWMLDLFTESSESMSGPCVAQIFRARAASDLSPRLPAMKPPTLVINGAFDGSLRAGTETAGLIPDAVHKIIPETGHACLIENPDAFDAIVIPFLKGQALWPKPSV